jgi:hypothetical protein
MMRLHSGSAARHQELANVHRADERLSGQHSASLVFAENVVKVASLVHRESTAGRCLYCGRSLPRSPHDGCRSVGLISTAVVFLDG